MGLDTSHDCWHGSYGSFNRWRIEVARAAGLPPLDLMVGHYDGHGVTDPAILSTLPISWDAVRPTPLRLLLNHPDCEGELAWQDCAAIADALEALIPSMGEWTDRTQQFVNGLRLAAKRKENVDFH